MKKIMLLGIFLIISFYSCELQNNSTDENGSIITVTDQNGNPLSDVGLHFYMDFYQGGLEKRFNVTDIGFEYFSITEITDSSIILEWATNYEFDIKGFLLYRTNGQDSVLIASYLTDSTLISHGTQDYGDSYLVEDHHVDYSDTYTYFLFYENYIGNIIFIEKANSITTIPPPHSQVPRVFKLYQNYPNPFNPVTIIQFALPKSEQVSLTIRDRFDNSVIATLVDKELSPGRYAYHWYGLNDDSSYVTNNVYNYILEDDSFEITKQLFVNIQDPEQIRSLNCVPLAKSNSNGIINIDPRLSPINQEVIGMDSQGNETGVFDIPEELYLVFIKEGYESFTKKVQIDSSNPFNLKVVLNPIP